MTETTKVNPYEYVYDNDQVIAINANALLSFMSFCDMVIQREPNIGALLVYPKNVNEIKDAEGNLIKWILIGKNTTLTVSFLQLLMRLVVYL